MAENRFLNQLKERILLVLQGERVKVFLFGSRARGQAAATADVDVAIVPYGPYDKRKLALLKDQIEDLNIPYRVDLVDFSEVTEAFKREALKGSVAWKD